MFKFMDWCHDIDRKSPGMGMLICIVTFTFAILLISMTIVGSVYKLSGASDRYQNEKRICREKGGDYIYVKGTGYLCISGVIKVK